MRRIFSILALLAIVWAFAVSPFSHLHPGELAHSQLTGLVHIHLEEALTNEEATPSVGLADTDPVDIAWKCADADRCPVCL